MRSHFRDCQAWEDYGIKFGSTTSNEAVKLYDSALTQMYGWYSDPSQGGIDRTVDAMLEADPNFAMGHVLKHCMGRPMFVDPKEKARFDEMAKLPTINEWESRHIKAVSLLATGQQVASAAAWEDILVDYPQDPLALKVMFDICYTLGRQAQFRDCIARVIPLWKKDAPLANYLHGMHSFGLMETNFLKEAEIAARKGLELDRKDRWSTHCLAHVFEESGRQDDGISFLTTTKDDWLKNSFLGCHTFWHLALFYLEKGDHKAALELYDAEIIPRVSPGASGPLVDATSFLFRLHMEGVDVGSRWEPLHEYCKPQIDDHNWTFRDAHLYMAFIGFKDKETGDKLAASVEEYVCNPQISGSDTHHVTKGVGVAVIRALRAYSSGEFAEAVEHLLPRRYELSTMGGSSAQRDVLKLFLIHCCMKSPERHHNKLAMQLLYARKALKESSPLTDRLMAQCLALENH